MPICKILRKTIETYGRQNQTMKCIEEVGELLQAVSKYELSLIYGDKEDQTLKLDHLREEIADCCIMLEQMQMMYGEKEIAKKIIEKTQRLEERLKNSQII